MPRTTLGLQPILLARRRIAPFINSTPLVYSAYLSQRSGAQVWLKPECFQKTGSFKARGALNKVGMLSEPDRAQGLVTGSAGNHGLGVAFAARAWGGLATDIFVPTTAPVTKVHKLEQLGARVHLAGDSYEQAHQAGEDFSRESGAVYLQAYDDLDVVAGQGTVGLEIMQEMPDLDTILVPVGGGGLIAGIATAAKSMNPGCRVIGLQPQASPAAMLSLRDGRPYDPYDHEPTIADGLAGGFGAVPFHVAGTLIDEILLASETDMRSAIFTLLDREQMVVEASGAIAIAPLLSGESGLAGQTVVCVLTGGNIATGLMRDILNEFCNGK